MNEAVKSELLAIAAADPHGILRAEAVVEYAKSNPASALRERLEWDDAEAAHEYRLMQARQLIRAYVKFEPRVARTVRGFVSVATDRAAGGGYRPIENVLDNPIYRGQLVEQAINDLLGVKKRYEHLPELDPLFASVYSMVEQFKSAGATEAA
jgi:hypothetical protein